MLGKVKMQENLFRLNHTANLTNGYQPLFWTNVSHMMGYNETKVNYTRTVCGSEELNRECYFDFAVTGNKEMAQSGKALIEKSKSIISATGKGQLVERPHIIIVTILT